MIYKYLYKISVIFLVSFNVNSQIRVIDFVSEKGIAFVEIYSSRGDLIGLTDINGYIDKLSLKIINQSNKEKIYFNHLTYSELVISKEKLLASKEIKLHQSSFSLSDVVIKAHKNKNNFIKLHGFYRSYQMNNNELKYYTDGIITYYLPLGAKNKIRNKLLSNRSFINKKLKEKKRINTVSIIMAGIPRPDKRLTTLFIENENYIFHPKDETSYIIKNNEKQVGVIQSKHNKKLTSLKIAYLFKDNPVEKKMLRYHSIREMHNGFAYFKTKDLDSLSLEKLLYHKEIRRLKFKHKKENDFQQIESLHEFFVTKIELVEKIDDNNLSKWFGFNKTSHYKTEYWKEFHKHQFYNPLPKSIEKQLGTLLTEVKNNDD